MNHYLHFSLYCPRCHRNRTFSIRKNYENQSSFILKCEGHDGRCAFTQMVTLEPYHSVSIEAKRDENTPHQSD